MEKDDLSGEEIEEAKEYRWRESRRVDMSEGRSG